MIEEINWGSTKVYSLETKRMIAWFLPSFGSNLIRLFDKKHSREILRTPKDIETLMASPEYYGVPILFPPNRVRGGAFTWRKEEYTFPINTPEGHHIHGVTLSLPWRFSSLDDGDDKTTISSSFEFADHLGVYEGYKRLLKLTAKISLHENELRHKLLVENLDAQAAPVGYGLHTWFHLQGGRNLWKITLPFEKVWELDEEALPTGVLNDGEKISSLKTGVSLQDKAFDTVFYRGTASGECTLEDTSGYKIGYNVDSSFMQWVVHTPLDADDSIAIEPYTWVTNAPNVKLPDSKTGFNFIEPGRSREFQTTIVLPQ